MEDRSDRRRGAPGTTQPEGQGSPGPAKAGTEFLGP